MPRSGSATPTRNDDSTNCHFRTNACKCTFIDAATPDGRKSRYIAGYSCENGTVESKEALKTLVTQRKSLKSQFPNLVDYEAELAFKSFHQTEPLPGGGTPVKERACEQVVIAQERAEAHEWRALLELDQERTARQKSEQAAEDLRGELAAARSEAWDAAVAQAEVRARLEAQAVALADRLAAAEQAQHRTASDLDAVQTELAAAQRQAERGEAEAALSRQLLAELRVAPRKRTGVRRKGGGPALTTNQEANAPAALLNPNDGNDGNEK